MALCVRFGVQLGLGQTPALIKAKNKMKRRISVHVLSVLRAFNYCQCLQKAEFNTKTTPNGHHSVPVWVHFGVQIDYWCRLKSVPSNRENRVWWESKTINIGTFVVISILFLGDIIPLFFILLSFTFFCAFYFFKYHIFYLICLLLTYFFYVLSFWKNLFPFWI